MVQRYNSLSLSLQKNRLLKRFVFFLFVSLTFTSFSQKFPNLISPSKVTTIGYWNKNQTASYTVSQTSSSFKGKSDKASKSSTSTYEIRLKVVDSTEFTYVFEMVYSKSKMEDAEIPIAKELASLQDGMKIRYQTNELGQFDTILNLPELKTELFDKLQKSKSMIADGKIDEEMQSMYSMLIDNLIKNLEKLESVEAIFAEDIYSLHGLYGIQLELSKPLPVEMQYSTLGNIEMSGTGTITLSSINKTGDQCLINETDKPNKEELKEYLQTLALLFMIDEGKKMSMEELQISMNTKKKITMELSTGWMNKIVTTSTVKLTNKKGDRRKVTVSEYKRK